MDHYTALADERLDILEGVYENLRMCGAHEDRALKREVCLELLAHLTGSQAAIHQSVQ